MSERQRLEQAIAALEAQRAGLDEGAVDAVLAGLRQKLAELEEGGEAKLPPAPTAPGERRIVTVLFCDVVGSTAMAEKMDPEAWAEIMNGAFTHIAGPVDRHGGTITRLLGDAILAFFGAPVAHEDDPQRAVLAGLAILENINDFRKTLEREQALDFNVRVGINTGLVVAGKISSGLHEEYTALGDAVNLAARMEQTAQPGTVQITENTYRLVSPLFDFEPLGGVPVKGKRERILAFRVLGRKEEPQRVRGLTAHGIRSALVGREAEYMAAKEAILRLERGEGGILSIIGEAGIGKSRLMAELRGDFPPGRLTWLEGRSLSYGQNIGYRPFQEILWAYAGITEDDQDLAAWNKLEGWVKTLFPENTAEVLPYLAALLALKVTGEYAERVDYLDSGAMGAQILVASRRFFGRLAQQGPVILVFEDLHWMDASSVRLLEHLSSLVERVPLLFCGISRPDLDSPAIRLRELAAQAYAERYTEVQIAPLSWTDSERLIHNLLDNENLESGFRDKIVSKADGNPFFLEEIIRDMIEGGAVVQDRAIGRWRATTQAEAINVPDNIQGVITARIDRLDEDLRLVLKAAAVIGRNFLYRVLCSILEADSKIDGQLAKLQAVELIRKKDSYPEVEYIFKHALAQQATYETILIQERRALHIRAGEAIEKLFADRLEEFYGLLAYHFSQAEDWQKAQAYLLYAGDQAGRLAADAEALTNYRRAMVAYERAFGEGWEPIQQAKLDHKMGEAYYGLGRMDKGRDSLHQALAILDRPLPDTKFSLLASFLGQAVRQAAHRLWPSRFIGRAPEEKKAILREAVLVYLRLGTILLFEGESAMLTYLVLRALNLAEKAGPSPELARMYAGGGFAAGIFTLHPLARLYDRLAFETAEKEGDPASLAFAYQARGTYLTGLGDWDKAIAANERAAEIDSRIGWIRYMDESIGNLAEMANLRGQSALNKKLFGQVLESTRERDDRQLQYLALFSLAGSSLRLGGAGDEQEVLDLVDQAKTLMESHQSLNRPDQIKYHGLTAQVRIRQGEWELARQAADMGAEFTASETWPSVYYNLEGYVGPVMVYLALWEANQNNRGPAAEGKELQKLARQSCQHLRRYARVFPVARPRANLYQGLYDWLARNPGKARKAWQKSLAQAEGFGMLYEQGLAHYEIGRHLDLDDPNRKGHLDRAVELFAEIQAPWDLVRAEELRRE